MQICNIQNNINSAGIRSLNIQKPQAVSATGNAKVNFCGNIAGDSYEFLLPKLLNKIKHFTIAEYKTLTSEELAKLREYYGVMTENKMEEYYRFEFLHDFGASKIKDYCDKLYGKGKYKIIIIGRSLSSIGKVLGYKIGEDNVINIPLSEAGQYLEPGRINRLKKLNKTGFAKFVKFLQSKGLSKEIIEKSDKKFLITDYCSTGVSLRGAKQLFTDKDVLGEKNVETLSTKDFLDGHYESVKLKSALCYCDFKKFSYVDRAETLQEVPQASNDPHLGNPLTRLFRFKLLDDQMQKVSLDSEKLCDNSSFLRKILDAIFNF